jgi:hypothetical protein
MPIALRSYPPPDSYRDKQRDLGRLGFLLSPARFAANRSFGFMQAYENMVSLGNTTSRGGR